MLTSRVQPSPRLHTSCFQPTSPSRPAALCPRTRIGAGGEDGVVLKHGADAGQVQLIHLHENLEEEEDSEEYLGENLERHASLPA